MKKEISIRNAGLYLQKKSLKEDCPPPAGYKDYNEWLVAAKLNLNRMNKRADEPVRA